MSNKENIEKMDGKSKDVWQEKLEAIKKQFPEIISDNQVDCEKLQKLIGEENIAAGERYNFSWAGKSNAIQEIKKRTTATLKPDFDESEDFDNTENIFIEGENLEVLRVLQKSYYNKVKMIYIDPPYNTGNDFVYNDKFAESREEYEETTGDVDEEGKKIRALQKNTKESGHYHSNWLNMMYPRLYLARNLLREDGVIFVSIDDNEVHNLRMIMNEIFGEENFVAEITRITKKGGNKGFFVKPKKDYILFYFKNKLAVNLEKYGLECDPDFDIEWKEEKFKGKIRKFKKGDIPYREKLDVRPNQRYYIKAPDNTLLIPPGNVLPKIKKDAEQVKPKTDADKCWSWTKNRYLSEKAKNRFLFAKSAHSPFMDENGNQAKWTVYKKVFREEILGKREIMGDYLDNFANSKGTKELGILNIPFNYPKPSELIKHLLKYSTNNKELILDFFSGSASSAHAVMDLNKEDGGNRKYIMVQMPEETDEDSETYKAGYKNIADIAKERIRRAAKKIKKEKEEKLDFEGNDLDLGFKVFKLSNSNFKTWRREVIDSEKDLQQKLQDYVENLKSNINKKDMLYELILKLGIDPNTNIQDKDDYYLVENGEYLICLEKAIDKEIAQNILEEKPNVVVCLDVSFEGNDELKTNTALQMKAKNIEFKVV